ncbi:MAG: hypothetical protein E5V22_33785 [Mesorhizobium sp.]|nr:MAG: hypothetical protein E5V34_08055 [Mesorhizobium sp.]TIX96751.1 MAG: hypothetical protein E5V22_33785 [Mesorhizobium sp.]
MLGLRKFRFGMVQKGSSTSPSGEKGRRDDARGFEVSFGKTPQGPYLRFREIRNKKPALAAGRRREWARQAFS